MEGGGGGGGCACCRTRSHSAVGVATQNRGGLHPPRVDASMECVLFLKVTSTVGIERSVRAVRAALMIRGVRVGGGTFAELDG